MTATALLLTVVSVAGLAAYASPAEPPILQVRESRGVYSVEAQFQVAQAPRIVHAVLTDYEQIPRFMPDVRKSVVLHRTDSSAVVEQEAVPKMLMFSKRVHLVLEISEQPETIRFRDRCGQSFSLYEGSWTLSELNGRTVVRYRLTAKPSFDVPEFILKRLLRRDAGRMIERLQGEVGWRAVGSAVVAR